MRARPRSVGIIVLDCVDTGGLLLGLQLHLRGPGEGAGHGGAEEDVDTEHDEEEDPEHDTEPEQPGWAQVAVPGVGWNITVIIITGQLTCELLVKMIYCLHYAHVLAIFTIVPA